MLARVEHTSILSAGQDINILAYYILFMQQNLFQELQELMIRHKFRPEKDYSQNFMVDSELLELIIFHAKLKKSDVVLEIGPGVGFLTQELVKKCRVVAVEADPRMAEILKERVQSKNLCLVEGDFLKAELPKFSKVVSLPPYSISSEIIYRLLSYGFDSACLVFQKEFAEKLAAFPGLFDYGPITVMTNYYCDTKILIESITPNSFFPKPKSFSSLIELKCRKRFGIVADERLFAKFIGSIFRYRNKNLRNAMLNSYCSLEKEIKFPEEEFRKKVELLKLKDEKVYLIEVRDYVKIFNELFP